MTWPLVDVHDDGIRPAGAPDECFYCRMKVGQLHAENCSIVHKIVELEITASLPDGTKILGTWTLEEAHRATPEEIEHRYNEGTWCVGNIDRCRDKIVWHTDRDAWTELQQISGCWCGGEIRFRFVRVVDPFPRRGLREPESVAILGKSS